MPDFGSHQLNPKTDCDALLVLVISLVIMFLTAGLFYWLTLAFIIHTARSSSTLVDVPGNPIYILFGKKLINGLPDSDYRSRLTRLLQCQFDTAIIMGGNTGDSNNTEAEAGLVFLQQHGLRQKNKVLLEQSSKNTLENLKNTRQILNNSQVVIISNRYHLARCSALANSLGISHKLCAAESSLKYNGSSLIKCMQEAFFIHWFFAGKYWAVLTANQRMLEKIS